MNANDTNNIANQLLHATKTKVCTIQSEGYTVREEISMVQHMISEHIHMNTQKACDQDRKQSELRAEFLRQLGDATAAGNFAEMERIRVLLSKK